MAELTKEWLQKTIAELEEERDETPGAVNEDAAKALAAMKLALASFEAEAVAYIREGYGLCYFRPPREYGLKIGDKLYADPPAPASVPDAIHSQGEKSVGDDYYALGWNACRAAMLQGAEHVSNRDELPDGWVMLPAEPTQAMMNAWLSEVANWRGHAAGYRAMIAAAPQQEVK
ncbi:MULTISPECIES: hypothetical protein [Enterobacter cloacae complex]|uniref:hypothetical protein n=1 Tax=Enterobacter cloacae complex TaxID=354276 RepID=UPI0018737D1E|nr:MULTISPECIES: hypothetical protein [Enterobacter cloacae complex]MBE4892094.1 hypothetical protein [Enterobacter cloacae complex sp. P16RS2]